MPAIVKAGLGASVALASPNGVGLVTVDISGTTATITVTMEPDGVYRIRAWLADSDTDLSVSQTVPDTSNVADWGEVLTDSTGVATFTVQHVAAAREWYFCWAAGTYVNVHETPIEVGV